MQRIFIMLLALSIAKPAYAWNFTDFKNEISSPFYDSTARNTLIVGTSLSIVLTAFFKESIINKVQDDLANKDLLGDLDEPMELFGRDIPNAAYALIMMGDYYLSEDKENSKSLEAAEVMFKATVYAGLVTNILKYTIREKRPAGSNRNSFPSGHTTTVFAFASVLAERHPWYIGVPAYAVASVAGLQRIAGNAHYLHDVIMGAAIGTAFGIGMNRLISKSPEQSNLDVSLIPTGSDSFYFNLAYRF